MRPAIASFASMCRTLSGVVDRMLCPRLSLRFSDCKAFKLYVLSGIGNPDWARSELAIREGCTVLVCIIFGDDCMQLDCIIEWRLGRDCKVLIGMIELKHEGIIMFEALL